MLTHLHSRWFICFPKLRFSDQRKTPQWQTGLCPNNQKQGSYPFLNNHPVIISYYCHYNELLLSPFCIIKDFGDYGNSKKKFCIFLYEYAGNIKKPVNLSLDLQTHLSCSSERGIRTLDTTGMNRVL